MGRYGPDEFLIVAPPAVAVELEALVDAPPIGARRPQPRSST